MGKLFIHFKTKAAFTAAALGTDYTNNSIVFIQDSQEIWTHGTFYAIPDTYKNKITNLETAVSALQTSVAETYAVKKISDGENIFSASSGKESITFKSGANTKVTVDATTGEVTVASTLNSTSYYPYADGQSLESRMDAVETSKIDKINGSDAIEVTGEDSTRAIALKLNNGTNNVTLAQTEDGLSATVTNVDALVPVDGVVSTDKVLSLTNKKIGATIALAVDSTADSEGKKYIRLTGKDGADLGKIDIAEFVKDGMLSSASFNSNTNMLTLTFNTDSGKEAISVDLSSLVDVYDGSNVKLKAVAVPTTDAVEPTANDTVDVAIANLIKKDRELAAAIEVVSDKVDENKDATLDLIEKGTDGDFVTTTITEKANNRQKVSVAVKTDVAVADATTASNGLATALAVQTYVQDELAWVEKD